MIVETWVHILAEFRHWSVLWRVLSRFFVHESTGDAVAVQDADRCGIWQVPDVESRAVCVVTVSSASLDLISVWIWCFFFLKSSFAFMIVLHRNNQLLSILDQKYKHIGGWCCRFHFGFFFYFFLHTHTRTRNTHTHAYTHRETDTIYLGP